VVVVDWWAGLLVGGGRRRRCSHLISLVVTRAVSLSPLSSLVLSSAFAGGGRRKQSPSNQAHTPFVLYFYTLGREVAWARSIGEKHFVYWYEVQNR
jgi:hypothetical protein